MSKEDLRPEARLRKCEAVYGIREERLTDITVQCSNTNEAMQCYIKERRDQTEQKERTGQGSPERCPTCATFECFESET
jgi:hypothetical protein